MEYQVWHWGFSQFYLLSSQNSHVNFISETRENHSKESSMHRGVLHVRTFTFTITSNYINHLNTFHVWYTQHNDEIKMLFSRRIFFKKWVIINTLLYEKKSNVDVLFRVQVELSESEFFFNSFCFISFTFHFIRRFLSESVVEVFLLD